MISNNRLAKIINYINLIIDTCGLPVTFRNQFTRLMNRAIHANNRKRIVVIAGDIEHAVHYYKPLQKCSSINRNVDYIFETIFYNIMPFDTLGDIRTKIPFTPLFDFINDEDYGALRFRDHVKESVVHQRRIPPIIMKKVAKHNVPYIYYDNYLTELTLLSKIIVDNEPWVRAHKIPNVVQGNGKANQKKFINEGVYLQDLNEIVNRYLLKANIIKKCNDGYQLSQRGVYLIDPRRFRSYVLYFDKFKPYKLISALIPAITILSYVNQNPTCHKYFGLAFILKLVNYQRYKEIDNYNDLYSNNNILGLHTFSYLALVLCTIDTYFEPKDIRKNLKDLLLKLSYFNISVDKAFHIEK